MLMSEHSMPAGRKFSECSSHSAGSIFSRDGSIKDGAGNIQVEYYDITTVLFIHLFAMFYNVFRVSCEGLLRQ